MRPNSCRTVLLAGYLSLLLGPRPAAAGWSPRTVATHGADGPAASILLTDGASQEDRDFVGTTSGERSLLWHRYLPDPIYTSVGASGLTNDVYAGNWFMAPIQVESIPLAGDGTPAWVHPGAELFVDAARASTNAAALDYTQADSTVTVREWDAGSGSSPVWSFPVHPCRPLPGDGWASGKGIQVSDDGSTIAVLVNMYEADGLNGRLLVFDRGQGTPTVDYPLPDGTGTALALTPDGAFIAIYAWPYIYVFDRYAETLRWSGPAYSGNDALAISGDGRYLAWGWSNLYLREWTGSTYSLLWQTSHGGYYVTECALSPAGERFAVAWYNNTSFDENVVEMYALPSHELIWSYNYSGSLARLGDEAAHPSTSTRVPADLPRNPVEVVSELVFSSGTAPQSPDGAFLAASSWGGTWPEIHLFARDEPTPVLVHDTPGTMFDIDVVDLGTVVYVAAGGKHVHAGTGGRGGDLYAFELGDPTDVGDGGDLVGSVSVRVHPNPSSGRTRLILSHTMGPGARVTIFDQAGRRVADATPHRSGSFDDAIIWDGKDRLGCPVVPGVYFARAETGVLRATARIVIVR